MVKQIIVKTVNSWLTVLALLMFMSITGYASSDNDKSIDYLATHGYALGVASNFNVFATDSSNPTTADDYAYIQASNLANARVAAGSYRVNNYQQLIGWEQPNDKIDSHMLIVGKRSNDSNTDSTVMNTDKTEGVFAAEDPSTQPLANRVHKGPVKVDPLSDVKDFTDNGISTFAEAQNQVDDVSQFYASSKRLTAAFSNKFMQSTTLDADQSADLKTGKEIEINDTNSKGHKFLVINIPGMTEDDIKSGEDQLHIKIKYVTNLTQVPIVIINFPNLKGDLELHNGAASVDVSYGTADEQNQISDKKNLLLNFPQLNSLELTDAFIGTVLAPQATIQINQFNALLNALVAKRLRINNSVTTNGPNGVFNPPDFQDASSNQNVDATSKHIYANGKTTTSTSFDSNSQMPEPFAYDDQEEADILWTGAEPEDRLYRSTNGKDWQVTKAGSDSNGDGSYTETEKPAHNLQLSQGQTASGKTLTADSSKTIYFALADGDPSDKNSDVTWKSSIQMNMEPFSVTVPNKIVFDSYQVKDGMVSPVTTPLVQITNQLGANFTLELSADANSSATSTTDPEKNVFLGSGQFTYNQAGLNEPINVFTPKKKSIASLPSAPILYYLNGFQLKVPVNLMKTPAKIGLKWDLNWQATE